MTPEIQRRAYFNDEVIVVSPAVITLVILAVAAFFFVTDKLPIALTAMMVATSLVLTGILPAKAAFAGFSDGTVILFGAMFIVGGALFETGMAYKIGKFCTSVAKSERQLLVIVMIVTATLSSVLSNTGTIAVLLPIVIGISASSGINRSKILMPFAFAAGMGGTITLIGTPANAIAKTALEAMTPDRTLTFFEYSKTGIPLTIAGIIFMGLIGHKLVPARATSDVAVDSGENNAVPAWKQYVSLIVMVLAVAGMVFEKRIGIPLFVTGIVGALTLILTGVITEKQAYAAIDMRTIFLTVGMMPMASALNSTGAGKMIADVVLSCFEGKPSPYVITAVMFLLGAGLTQFMTINACTTLLAPIAVAIAQGLGARPVAVVMAVLLGANAAFCTPIAMTPNTMVYGYGEYKFTDYVRVGFPLEVIYFIGTMILAPVFWPFY